MTTTVAPAPSAPLPPAAPPCDLEAEQSVLGALLLSQAPQYYMIVEEGLRPADFYRRQHAEIFASMLARHREGKPIDPITVADQMRVDGTFRPPHGQAEIDALTATVPAISNLRRYAEIVRETAVRRRILAQCYTTMTAVHEPHGTRALGIATDAATAFQDLGRDLAGRLEVSAADAVDDQATHFERRRNGDLDDLLLTGYPDLDDLLEGLEPGSLYYVAARPGVGKTAFGLGLLHNLISDDPALGPSHRCLLYTLEMSDVQIIQRMLAARASVALSAIRRPDRHPVSDTHLARIHDAQHWVRTQPFDLVPRSVQLSQLAGHARWLANRHRTTKQPLRCVIVDYVQLVGPDDRGDSRYREVTDISLGLKRLAVDLEIPVIAMAQLSRESERRGNHKPQLSDLRDSGQLEQDAHAVMLLYRDELYDPDSDDAGILQVDVAKNRQGSLGVCKLAANLETQRIMSLVGQRQ
jgi:replicative DNA helicase